MVTRYFNDEVHEFRRDRFNGRGHGYPLSHDRDLSSGPNQGPYGGHIRASIDGRNGQSPEVESNSSLPRRRIPVACGRCRKRKIRCSGDPGNGGPCSNCKAAGNEQCQFLRVSSTEAHIKNESSDFGAYDPPQPAVSRIHCRMVPYGPQSFPEPTPLGPDGYICRPQSLAAYQYHLPPKHYYPVASFPDSYDDNAEYNFPGSYPLAMQDQLGIPAYANSNVGRGWNAASQPPKTSLFPEQDPYNHGQYPVNYIRPAISPESKSISFGSMASSLPVTTGTDRMLPLPPAATARQEVSYLRSDNHGSNHNSQSTRNLDALRSNNGLMSMGLLNAVKAMNTNSVTDNASMPGPYMPLSTTSEGLPSSQIGYSSQQISSAHQQSQIDPYPSNENGMYLHASNSVESLHGSYQPSSSPSSKGRVNSRDSDASPTSTISSGQLSNGHEYVPYVQQMDTYPMPPSATPLPMHPRRSITSIQGS